jgi:hypothetical protein
MFIDNNSASNPIVPSRPDTKPSLCSWILDFFTGQRFLVNLDSNDCLATHSSNSVLKFNDETTVTGPDQRQRPQQDACRRFTTRETGSGKKKSTSKPLPPHGTRT